MVAKPAVDVSKPSPNRNGYSHTRRVDAVVWHITSGTDSLGWLRNPASKASSNYLITRTGYIFELVPPDEDPWTNGAVCNADKTNPLIPKWDSEGVNYNQRTVTIEHEGFSSLGRGGSLTPAQSAASINLTAWLCQAYRITPDHTHIMGHYEIDSCNRPNCPGFSQAEWAAWIQRIASLVAGAAPLPPPEPPPFEHDPGFLDPIVDTFNWGGAGIIVYRKIRVYNDQEQRFYEREWSGNMGYSGWEVIG